MVDVVGIDRARRRWLAVRLIDGRFSDAWLIDRLGETHIEADTVAIDIPLSLPTDAIGRQAEFAAKDALGPRRSSVFLSIPERYYRMPYDPDTRKLARSELGAAFSSQAWNIGSAILEAIGASGPRWIETHPELGFRHAAGRNLDSKHRWNGLLQRMEVLDALGIELPSIEGDIAPNDAVDAAMCAYVAHRYATGHALSVPEDPSEPKIWF